VERRQVSRDDVVHLAGQFLEVRQAARRKRKLVDSDIVRDVLAREHSPSLA
jgi:hypothetical protein